MIEALVNIVSAVLGVLVWIIIGQAILSWLVAFNVINTSSPFVRGLLVGLDRLTAPMYRPIRRVLPDFGGIDFSPLILIFAISLLTNYVLPGILAEVGPTIT